jgi:NTE family protein
MSDDRAGGSRDVVLVFGGGGVKAAAHVGAWRAVLEAGRRPVRYVGTSMGAVMAAAFAAGLTAGEVGARMAGIRGDAIARPRADLAQAGLAAPSLFELEPLREVIEQVVPVRSFAGLAVPLAVTAVDLDSGELVLFGNGERDAPLVDALLASCALPFFYPPVLIEGRRYADGGLRAVLPLGPAARPGGPPVIAIDTGPGFDEPRGDGPQSPALVEAHNGATGILMAANTGAAVELWRATPGLPHLVYVRPRVEKHVTFRVDLAAKYADEGYRATREALSQLADA